MRFSDFIRGNLDPIVAAWEAFARTLPAAQSMSGLALRDHCRAILITIADDMETGQTPAQQARKSMHVAPPPGQAESAAESHGALRHVAGFDLAQLVAEFRALRASVLALWQAAPESSAPGAGIGEITRFNEGLDQALAESVDSYSADLAASRDMFIGVLGHDLRSPLSALTMCNHLLQRPDLPEPARMQAAARAGRAVDEMNRLIADLLDYTRSRLGPGIPIEPAPCDLGEVCRQALDAMQAAHPDRRFELGLSGPLQASADVPKMRQALANLLGNAVQHGDPQTPIRLNASAAGDVIEIEVVNEGPVIPAAALGSIFEALTQGPQGATASTRRLPSSLGLGLFIAREVVKSHHGSIRAESSVAATTFFIRLPRRPPPDAATAAAVR